MLRHIALISLGLAAVGGLNAGYIQIGGNTGLTSAYGVTLTGGASEQSYNGTMFQGTGTNNAAVTGINSNTSLCAGATIGTCVAPASTAVISGEPNNEFATGGGVTFALINETISSVPMGVWASPGNATSSFTIPIGIFAVTNVYTMLNDEFGLSAAGSNQTTTVKFDFGSSATVGTSSETFTLVNGKVIRSDWSCTGTSLCASVASTLDTTNAYDLNGALIGAIGSTTAANVSAFNVWKGSYSTISGGPFANTSGNLNLDAQNFFLGSAATGNYLVDVVITDNNPLGTTKFTKDALSAVTVLSSSSGVNGQSTPEPSTVLLFITGIGAIGFIRNRRKQQ